MATMQECETIEVIQKIKKQAKAENQDAATLLSGGKVYFGKAISSIWLSGLFTLVTSICLAVTGIAISVLEYVRAMQNQPMGYNILIWEIVGALILTIIPIILGIKIMRLNSTPKLILIMLIITLIFNLVFSMGVLPLLALILNIIALVRWSTYKSWFYNIDAKRSK